ncbi:MAG: DUF4097 family beta strand repeat protein [Rhodothermaceae bacterium]|nr:DUF4097 family beta strand repeat protein [Rhodothermaceae bacterium]
MTLLATRFQALMVLCSLCFIAASPAGPDPVNDYVLTTSAKGSAGYDVEDIVTKTFEVRSGGTLYLELDYGNIEIQEGGRNTVEIEMVRKVRVNSESEARKILEEHHEYSFENNRDDVIIESNYRGKDSGRSGRWNRDGKRKFNINIIVRVPEIYNVDFVTGAGNVEIEDIEGEVNGKTGAGNVDISDMDGAIDIVSGAGNIDIEGVTETVEVNTGAGNISLEDVQGFVRAKTGAGNITAKISEQPDRDSRLETGAGNVTVYLARDVGVYVDAVAAMGSASCDCALRVEGKWMKKSFEGEINGGGPDLFMRAGVGNVTLRKK